MKDGAMTWQTRASGGGENDVAHIIHLRNTASICIGICVYIIVYCI